MQADRAGNRVNEAVATYVRSAHNVVDHTPRH
jgi:hypothetical protein